MLSIYTIINTPVPSNCFVLYDKVVGNECIIIDPGSKSDNLLFAFLDKENLLPKYIILTHEHFDHCWGVNEFVEKYNIPIVCSALCAECIQYEKRNCSVFYDNKERFVIKSKTVSIESLNMELTFANTKLKFYITPGHTNGSICFTLKKFLFTGDTLIPNEKTVTKLPTGSVLMLKESLLILKDMKGKGYMVCPGHGGNINLDNYDLNMMITGK